MPDVEQRHQEENPLHILLVGGEVSTCNKLDRLLHDHLVCSVDIAHSGGQAEQFIQSERLYQIALIDDTLPQTVGEEPQRIGIDLVQKIKARYSQAESIVFIDYSEERALEALRAGAFGYLRKPINGEELAIVAGQAAEFQRLKRISRDNQILQPLMDTNTALLRGYDHQEVLNRIVSAVQTVGFDRVRLYLVSDDEKSLIGKAQVGMDKRFVGMNWPLADDYYMQVLLNDPHPHVFKHESSKPAHSEELLFKEGVEEWVAVPLVLQGRLIGELSADNKSTHRPIIEEELAPLALFASQAAVVIENARYAKSLKELYRASLDITHYQNIPELVKSILDQAVALLKAKGGGLYLLDESGERFKLAAVSNLSEDLLGKTWEVGGGVIGHVLRNKAPFFVSDYQNWPDKLLEYEAYSFTTVAGSPIAWQNKTWGVIAVHDDVDGRVFSQEDLNILAHLGNMAAVAYENARRVDERDRLIASAFDGIIAVNEAGEVVEFNKQAENLLGWNAEDVLGKSVVPLYYDPEEPGRIKQMLLRDFENKQMLPNSLRGRITDYDTSVRSKNGEEIRIRLSATLLFDHEENMAGSVGFFRDLQEIESAKQQVRQLSSLLTAGQAITSQLDLPKVLPKVRQLSELLAAGQAITSQLDLPTVLESICTNAINALEEVDAIILYPYDPFKKQFQVPPVTRGDIQSEFVSGHFNPDSVVARLMEKGSAHFADDAAADLIMRGEFVKREKIISSAGVPLKVGDNTVGVMFFNYRKPHPFNEEDKSVINILANQAAIAIENARLHGETQQRTEQLQALYEASLSLTAELSLDAVLQNLVNRSRNLVGAQYGALAVPDTERNIGTFITSGLESPEVERIGPPPIGQGVLGLLLREPHPIRMRDISEHLNYTGFSPHHPKMTSFLGVPIVSKNTIIGSLYTANKLRAIEFSPEDEDILEMLAAQAAIAIENARLYEETRQRLNESEALQRVSVSLTETLELTAVLDGVMRAAIRLTKAHDGSILLFDANRGEFTSALKSSGPDQPLIPYPSQVLGQRESFAHRIIREDQPSFTPDTLDPSLKRPAIEKGRRAIAGVPLRWNAGPIGVLYLNWNVPRLFSDQEKNLLIALASQAAVAIQNAQHHEGTRNLLYQVSRAKKAAEAVAKVMALGDSEKTLRSITDQAQDAVGCDAVVLYEYDRTKKTLNFPPTYIGLPYKQEAWPYQRVPPNSIAYKMLQQDDLYIAERVDENPLFKNSTFAQQEGIKSCVAAPLKAAGEKVGVMFVNYFSYHDFTADEITNTQLFANQAAVAISNAQQYEALKRSEAYLSALYDAAKAITASFGAGSKKVLDDIVKQAVECIQGKHGLKAHLGTIELYNERTNELSFESVYPPEEFPNLAARIGHQRPLDRTQGKIGIAGRAVLNRRYELVNNDIQDDRDYIKYDSNTLSELAVPLLDQDSVLGVLNVESDQLDAFDQDDLKTLEALAELAVITIKNSEQHEELKEIKGLVGSRTVLAWMGMVSATWRHSIEGHVLAIRRTVKLLRRELNRNARGGRINPDVESKLDWIEDWVGEILKKPITPPLSSEEGVRSLSINSLIEGRIKELWRSDPYKRVETELLLSPDTRRTVRASPEWLRRAFDILVDNAVEAMATTPVRKLTITTHYSDTGSDTGVEIIINDTGVGISPNVQSELFRNPLPKPRGIIGFGIGLLIAQAIVETYRGELRLGSTNSNGTTFVIRLPLEPEKNREGKWRSL